MDKRESIGVRCTLLTESNYPSRVQARPPLFFYLTDPLMGDPVSSPEVYTLI